MRFLLLGSKEYPVGSSTGFDPFPSGGYEAYTASLTKALHQRGQHVLLITRQFPGLKEHEIYRGIHVWRVPWIKGFYLRTPSFAFFSLLKSALLKYDVIISNGMWATLVALVLKKIKKRPAIARPGGTAWNQPQYPWLIQRILFALERLAYQRADWIVFLSEGEKKNFESRLGFTPKKFQIIPTGIEIPTRKTTTKRGRVVLFVGRLIPVKGVSYLVKAMRGMKARLWVVGDGIERQKLEAMAEKERVDVDFFGQRKNVWFFLQKAQVFVLPSLSEGLPVALLEAYAAGVPCVVTDIGLPAEHERTALVVPSKNAPALRNAIRRLLNDKPLRKRLAKNALALAKTFSWTKAARAYEEVAKKCAES